MHAVAVLALPGVVPFDLAIPCEVFGRAAADPWPYTVRVCGEASTVACRHFALDVPCGLDGLHGADTVIVPGVDDVSRPVSGTALAALRAAAERGARIASICSGTFALAAAGLLDGLTVTTHWLAADLLAARYPRLRVDASVLFVDHGTILTSAGAAAGLDLCLHLVRRDLGAAVAADAARLAVMPLTREGGQAQFIAQEPPASPTTLEPLLAWMQDNLHRPLGIGTLADRAVMSPRTFARHFRQQTGTTPLQWLLTARVRRAQALLERTRLSVEEIATRSGFETAATFRNRFARVVGTTPSAYRRSFGTSASVAAGPRSFVPKP